MTEAIRENVDKEWVSRDGQVAAFRGDSCWLTRYGGFVRQWLEKATGASLPSELWLYRDDWSGVQSDLNQRHHAQYLDKRRRVLDRAPFRGLVPKFFAEVRNQVDGLHRDIGLEMTRARAIAGPLRLELFRRALVGEDALVRPHEVEAQAERGGAGTSLIERFDALLDGIEAQANALKTAGTGPAAVRVLGRELQVSWLEQLFRPNSAASSIPPVVFREFEPSRGALARAGLGLVDAVGRMFTHDHSAASSRFFPHLRRRHTARSPDSMSVSGKRGASSKGGAGLIRCEDRNLRTILTDRGSGAAFVVKAKRGTETAGALSGCRPTGASNSPAAASGSR